MFKGTSSYDKIVRAQFQDLKSDFKVNSHYTCEENEKKKKR